MKKIVSYILATVIIFTTGTTAFAESPVKLYVGGEKVESDVAPKIVDGRTMLPLRAAFEAIGAEVKWDGATQTVTATKGDKVITLQIGSNIMTVNGENKALDVAAYIENGRTMVPVRACAEAFDLKVDWFENSRTVKVRKEVSVLSEKKQWTEDLQIIKYEYDAIGNLIRKDYSGGFWTKYEYDTNGNLVYEEKSPGTWWDDGGDNNGFHTQITGPDWTKYEYDANGNLIYEEDESGTWKKYEYDANSNPIRLRIPEGLFAIWEYDTNGNEIYENRAGYWTKSTYDTIGNLIYEECSDGYWKKYEYDANSNLVYEESSLGSWTKYEYDNNGILVGEEYSSGGSTKYTYDTNNNLLRKDYSAGGWEKYEYDNNGNLLYHEESNGRYEKYIVVVK